MSRHAAPRFPLIRTHLNASENFITDTETSVIVHETRAQVIVRPVPGLRWWNCPSPRTLRKWVDEAAKERGLRRTGTRVEQQGSVSNWWFTYYLLPIEETPDQSSKMEVAA